MKQIKIYSTPACPYCHLEKDYLKEHGIDFTDLNVAADPAAAKEMVSKSGQMGVPVTIISDDSADPKEEIIVGFDKARLAEILGLK